MEVLYLAGTLMEHFIKAQKRRIVFVTLFIWDIVPNVLMEQFLQANTLLRHLLNEETRFMS